MPTTEPSAAGRPTLPLPKHTCAHTCTRTYMYMHICMHIHIDAVCTCRYHSHLADRPFRFQKLMFHGQGHLVDRSVGVKIARPTCDETDWTQASRWLGSATLEGKGRYGRRASGRAGARLVCKHEHIEWVVAHDLALHFVKHLTRRCTKARMNRSILFRLGGFRSIGGASLDSALH